MFINCLSRCLRNAVSRIQFTGPGSQRLAANGLGLTVGGERHQLNLGIRCHPAPFRYEGIADFKPVKRKTTRGLSISGTSEAFTSSNHITLRVSMCLTSPCAQCPGSFAVRYPKVGSRVIVRRLPVRPSPSKHAGSVP